MFRIITASVGVTPGVRTPSARLTSDPPLPAPLPRCPSLLVVGDNSPAVEAVVSYNAGHTLLKQGENTLKSLFYRQDTGKTRLKHGSKKVKTRLKDSYKKV